MYKIKRTGNTVMILKGSTVVLSREYGDKAQMGKDERFLRVAIKHGLHPMAVAERLGGYIRVAA